MFPLSALHNHVIYYRYLNQTMNTYELPTMITQHLSIACYNSYIYLDLNNY